MFFYFNVEDVYFQTFFLNVLFNIIQKFETFLIFEPDLYASMFNIKGIVKIVYEAFNTRVLALILSTAVTLQPFSN